MPPLRKQLDGGKTEEGKERGVGLRRPRWVPQLRLLVVRGLWRGGARRVCCKSSQAGSDLGLRCPPCFPRQQRREGWTEGEREQLEGGWGAGPELLPGRAKRASFPLNKFLRRLVILMLLLLLLLLALLLVVVLVLGWVRCRK